MARNRVSLGPPANNNTVAAADLGEAQLKKHRPIDTRLRQQRLPAWQPIFNARTVIPVYFSISLLFIPIGIVLLVTNNGVQEKSIYYDTECEQNPGPDDCKVSIKLDEDFTGDVYFYYGLENYYQNHRRYMRSRNDLQLLGRLNETNECDPFDKDDGKIIAPCGAIANSMFNDTFELSTKENQNVKLNWTHEELIWSVDRSKFRNPKCSYGDCHNVTELCKAFENYAKPPNWEIEPCKLDESDVKNSGFQNADFIIWMRTAAFPDFRKPYRKLKSPNNEGLKKGEYVLTVKNNYDISSFSGRKSFIISTTSWLGGKNPFLGLAFVGVGLLCAFIGAIFIFVHVKYGHSLIEMAGVDQTRLPIPSRHLHTQ